MKLQLKSIANPYTIFSISWLLCLMLYSFGWTDIFPKLSTTLIIFLVVLICLFSITGLIFNKLNLYTIAKKPLLINSTALLTINIGLYALNFFYSGIPILNGVRDDNFGIPTVIVLSTTLNCFTSIYCFYLFMQTRSKKFLLYSVFCLSFFVLAFSRGNIMMSIITMFFLWINIKLPNLTIKKFLGIISGILLVMYLFGVAGNYRTINDLNTQNPKFDKAYNSNVILAIGGASDSFKSSIVPGEFFWTYLYITSPLSNLQYNITKNKPSFTLNGVMYTVIDEILPDAVSKKINDLLGRKRRGADLIVDQLTVPTALTGSYNYAGWGGIAIFLIVFWLFGFIYTFLVLKNPLGIIGMSTLCTVYFFSIFDNMFTLTGLMLQLIFPIILFVLSKIKFNTFEASSK
ncbi:MAG: O-antigen polymerase [Janthinobacterium lividum]